MTWANPNLVKILDENGVAVMPTDTLYGIVGRAHNPATVKRIYRVRKRAPNKPCIILIGEIKELENFSINLSKEQKKVLEKYWPGPVSVVIDCVEDSFKHLHRGTKSLAFRLPALDSLRALLVKVGPLVAPSANHEGKKPAINITEAKKYFGNKVDLYVDMGEIKGKASKVIKLHEDGSVEILRD